MNTQDIHPDQIIVEKLTGFLEGTRLSMHQVAERWNVSSPMLSQIKNGKKKAGIDLGLKILRESGANVEERKAWLESRYFEESKEASLIKDSLQKTKVEKSLKESFCRSLESNPVLMNIFLDISIAEESGISWNSIFKSYGDYGVELATGLIEVGLVKYESGKYVISESGVTHIMDTSTSYGMLKGIIERFRNKSDSKKAFGRKLSWEINDLSRQGVDQLLEAHQRFEKECAEIIESNELHSNNGGIRVISQSLLGALKALLIVGFLTVFPGMDSWAGGLKGGDAGDFLQRREFQYRGDKYMWGGFTVRLHNQQLGGRSQAEALAKKVVDEMRQGVTYNFVTRSVTSEFNLSNRDEEKCRPARRPRAMELLEGGVIKPKNFRIGDSWFEENDQGEWTERFNFTFKVEFPCEKRD